MTTQTKLICLVLFMSAMLIMVALLGILGMKRDRARLETLYRDRLVCVIQLSHIEERLSDIRRDILVFIAGSADGKVMSAAGMDASASKIEAKVKETETIWQQYLSSNRNPEEKQLADAALSGYRELLEKGIRPVVALMRAGDLDGLKTQIRVVISFDEKSHEQIDNLIFLEEQVARTELDRNADDFRIGLGLVLAGMTLAMVAGAIISLITVRSVAVATNRLKESETLIDGQKRVLEMIATNAPLTDTLNALIQFLERCSGGLIASILVLDEDGVHVRHSAAPNMPETFVKAIDGAAIGPHAGSCGTAMFFGQPVVVSDIQTDELWENYRDLILPHGLRACWSTPIFSHDGKVLGSFAIYYREVRSPDPDEKRFVQIGTHIASIAIEHHRSTEEIEKATRRLKKSEERPQFASTAADIGTWHWDLVTDRLIWSDKCKELFGFPPDYVVTSERAMDSLHEEDRQPVRDAVRNALDEKTDYLGEMRVVMPDSSLRWIMSKGRGFYDSEGKVVGMHGIVMDITERKKYEQELLQARNDAEAASRAKSQFLANMSHELRTPMAGVLGLLELALEGPLEEEQWEYVNIAHNSAMSLVRILNDILEMTRIEAGMLSLEEQPFSLPDCIRSVVEIFQSEAHHKRLDLTLILAEDLSENVVGDCLRLRQVLTNLIGNAIKFTEQGRVDIKVRGSDSSPEGRRVVVFSVADTGIGIPTHKREQLFRSFYQVDASHTRRYGGTGLGLAISKDIVERMGGTMSFDCEEGAGCCFTFTVSFREVAGK